MLAEAGVEVVGENRAQDLEAKHAVYGDAFRWHFIGHLQIEQGEGRQRHLRARPLARLRVGRARGSTVPALVEVNLSGEATKSGVAAGASSPSFLRAYGDVRGLMTMPPPAADPEASRPYFRRLRELAAEHGLRELSMGTLAGLPRRRRGGSDATSASARVLYRSQ